MGAAPLLLEEALRAERTFRPVAKAREPALADIPVERVDPDPSNKRHWMAATDNNMVAIENKKIMMHIYKPDEVLKRFKKVVVPMYREAYGITIAQKDDDALAMQLIQDTLTYLHFHELFHSVYCPKSKTDEEKFDVALKNGIQRALPGITDRDLVNKAGNSRNAMWDVLIDNFFTYLSHDGNDYDHPLRREIRKVDSHLANYNLEQLVDGVVTTWDVVELADGQEPQTLFYPVTRALYALLHCRDAELRPSVYNYFKEKIGLKLYEPGELEKERLKHYNPKELEKIADSRDAERQIDLLERQGGFWNRAKILALRLKVLSEGDWEKLHEAVDQRMVKDLDKNGKLENVLVETLEKAVEYLSDHQLKDAGVERDVYLQSVKDLVKSRKTAKGTEGHKYVSKSITNINRRVDLRYKSMEGIIEPLARYIDVNKEEKRDGAYTQGEGEGGQGDAQSSGQQPGAGAEAVLQSLVNQNDPNIDQILANIAGDQSAPQNERNKRLSRMATDEYYKRHAKELPLRAPQIHSETRNVGDIIRPVKIGERLVSPDELANLPWEFIQRLKQEYGVESIIQVSPQQTQFILYELRRFPIKDIVHTSSGIILPDNIIFRIDGSGTMTMDATTPLPGALYAGSGNRYDSLSHVVYGVLKPAAKAAQQVGKKINVVVVAYSSSTVISEPVEIQHFLATPHNDAKKKLLDPEFGSTYHDASAWQAAHDRCLPGKTIEFVIGDGDLDSPKEENLEAVKGVLADPNNQMVAVSIYREGEFFRMLGRLAREQKNLKYLPLPSLAELQKVAHGLIINYGP